MREAVLWNFYPVIDERRVNITTQAVGIVMEWAKTGKAGATLCHRGLGTTGSRSVAGSQPVRPVSLTM